MPSHTQSAPTSSLLAIAGAAVIGWLLATISVFACFLVFNFILHWGS